MPTKSTIYKRKLKNAYREIRTKLSGINDWNVTSELEDAESTYQTMLDYMVKGLVDPVSDKLYSQLVLQSYCLDEKANRLNRIKSKPTDKYTLYCRNHTHLAMNEILASLEAFQEKTEESTEENAKNHDKFLCRMFESVWTSSVWNKSDYENAGLIISENKIPMADKALFVSAITLSLLEYFDPQKIMTLFDTYITADRDVAQRAMVGLMLAIDKYGYFIDDFKEISSRWSLLTEDERFVKDFFNILRQLQISKDTDKVNEKMRNEIMPDLIKSKDLARFGISLISDDTSIFDENPEWNKTDKKAEERLQNRIEEMNKLQNEGADIYMDTFSHMKNYPFFSEIAHWFTVFDINHPSLNEIGLLRNSNSPQMLKLFLNSSTFCDSDKFSFCFMMKMLPMDGQNKLTEQFGEAFDADTNSDISKASAIPLKDEDISRLYIHNLYRFFKVYPLARQFYNPFTFNIDEKHTTFMPNSNPLFCMMLSNTDKCENYADFLMKQKYFKEALRLFNNINLNECSDEASIWQKKAFCLYNMHDKECLEAFEHADRLNDCSKWTISHRAMAARFFGDYQLALQCYDRLLDTEPDNIKTLNKKGECLILLKDYKNALNTYYKINYLDEGSVGSTRTLCWLLIVDKEPDKALSYIDKISDKTANDKLNKAHALIIKGDVEGARAAYKESLEAFVSESDKGKEMYEKCFMDDAKELNLFDGSITKIQLMIDSTL